MRRYSSNDRPHGTASWYLNANSNHGIGCLHFDFHPNDDLPEIELALMGLVTAQPISRDDRLSCRSLTLLREWDSSTIWRTT